MADAARIPSPGETIYVGEPGLPLVVVLHDRYGRLPGVVEYAGALARVGFRVAVPDLGDGWATDDDTVADRLALAHSVSEQLAIVDASIAAERGFGSTRVATVGFADGGRLALVHAQSGTSDAVVAYDATLPDDEHTLIPCPVLLHVADQIDWPVGAGPSVFEARLADDGTPVTVHAYVGARRGFANASIRRDFEPNAAALAFARTAAFLERQLGE